MEDNHKTFKMIFFIKDYYVWDDIIYEYSGKFFEQYSIYPNIMLASKATSDKIDEYANLFNYENIINSEEQAGKSDDQDAREIKSIAFLSQMIVR